MGHSRNPSAASAISFCSVISEPISEVNEKEYGNISNPKDGLISPQYRFCFITSVDNLDCMYRVEQRLKDGLGIQKCFSFLCFIQNSLFLIHSCFLLFIETNWRNMVETSDGLEASETKKEEPASRTALPEKPVGVVADKGSEAAPTPPVKAASITPATLAAQPAKTTAVSGAEKDEGKPDDTLEWASQQSTETGSLDGSCRDLLNSSITSTTSTLVPGMLEEDEDEDEEEEEDYNHKPISVEVPLTSRIESWVTEAQKTLENLQLGKNQDSTEEDDGGHSDEEELEASEQAEPVLEHKEQQLKPKSITC
ncbi:UNVERIFIED_CONTAM: hypothetical protein FKN15_076988 [Acipenser sinensis]